MDRVWDEVQAEVLDWAHGLKKGKVRLQTVGTAASEKYLRQLCDSVWELHEKLDAIPLEAWRALPPCTDLNRLKLDLMHRLHQPLSEAIKNIMDDPRPGRSGRRTIDVRAVILTEFAAGAYEAATGRPATRKELADLLEEPFQILKLGKPNNCVRKYTSK